MNKLQAKTAMADIINRDSTTEGGLPDKDERINALIDQIGEDPEAISGVCAAIRDAVIGILNESFDLTDGNIGLTVKFSEEIIDMCTTLKAAVEGAAMLKRLFQEVLGDSNNGADLFRGLYN